jgi:RecG-like helicase
MKILRQRDRGAVHTNRQRPVAGGRGLSLDDPVESLPGAGPVTAARMAGRGLVRVRDLLTFFPRAYEDYRRTCALGELDGVAAGSSVVVVGKIVRINKFFRNILDVYLEENECTLRARWFRPNAGMAKSFERGAHVALAGTLRRNEVGRAELIHPSNVTAVLAESASVGIRARYPLIEKVPGRTVEKIVAAAVTAAAPLAQDVLARSHPHPARATGLGQRPRIRAPATHNPIRKRMGQSGRRDFTSAAQVCLRGAFRSASWARARTGAREKVQCAVVRF